MFKFSNTLVIHEIWNF